MTLPPVIQLPVVPPPNLGPPPRGNGTSPSPISAHLNPDPPRIPSPLSVHSAHSRIQTPIEHLRRNQSQLTIQSPKPNRIQSQVITQNLLQPPSQPLNQNQNPSRTQTPLQPPIESRSPAPIIVLEDKIPIHTPAAPVPTRMPGQRKHLIDYGVSGADSTEITR